MATSNSIVLLATRNHEAAEDDLDAHVLLDADLAILGAEPALYEAYAQAIRHEYAWLSEADFRQGRRQVLERFQQRDKIYHTEQMAAALEDQARQNIWRELRQFGG